ncbi:hypothetical protein RKD27_006215 [Streptomyces sp. SAI-126]|jgi:hypothetical protein
MDSRTLLPTGHENLALFTDWVARTVAELPPRHVNLIRPFAEWHVVRDARRRSAHGPYELGAGLYFGLEVVAEPVEEGTAIDG